MRADVIVKHHFGIVKVLNFRGLGKLAHKFFQDISLEVIVSEHGLAVNNKLVNSCKVTY